MWQNWFPVKLWQSAKHRWRGFQQQKHSYTSFLASTALRREEELCLWVPYQVKANINREQRLIGPITAAARSKASTVFARSNTRIVASNPTRGMDIGVRLFYVCVVLCVQVAALRRADPPSTTNCVKDQETEKVAKAQQRAVEP
jgi:hypothetical protein